MTSQITIDKGSMDRDLFVTMAKEYLKPILTSRGCVLNSSARTVRPGRFYFMGINPAGSDGTLLEDLDLFGVAPEPRADSFERSWGKSKPGRHPIQRGSKALFSLFGLHPRDVCCTNLIFAVSADETGAGYPVNADICWPVHEMLMTHVTPQVIVTFGGKVYEYVCARLHGTQLSTLPSGHGDWMCRLARTASNQLVLNVPHLSRYYIEHQPQVCAWIAGAIEAHRRAFVVLDERGLV